MKLMKMMFWENYIQNRFKNIKPNKIAINKANNKGVFVLILLKIDFQISNKLEKR